MKSIGLFCGTFNPIHTGHLILAECARDQFQLEKVFFVTSPIPPHRQDEDLLNSTARHAMVSAAVRDNPAFAASAVELDRSGPSYTYDTVAHFRELYPQSKISLLIGEDNLEHVCSWHRAGELLSVVHLLVAPRVMAGRKSDENARIKSLKEFPDAQIDYIDFPYVEVSATTIRERVHADQSILYMVPETVRSILQEKRYYKD